MTCGIIRMPFAQAINQLRPRRRGTGPYSVLLSADAYTALAEARDYGEPRAWSMSGRIVTRARSSGPRPSPVPLSWTTRGGDFDLYVGQDFSIGYASHTDNTARPPIFAGNVHIFTAHG